MTENKESLREKFKSLWSLRGPSPKTSTASANKDSIICDEFWLDISASQPIDSRVDKLKEVFTVVENNILDDAVIKRLWLETKDLLQPNANQEMRLFELRFVQAIIKGQYRHLGLMRAVFFQALQEHSAPEDLLEIVKTFEVLTDNGKDAELFEQELGPCLINWLSAMKGEKTLLSLLINIIKFNSSYLDQDAIMSMLKFVCDLCKSQCEEEERKLGLQVVDAVMCYSSLPRGSLNSVTIMLCSTLNMKKFCNQSWKLMRKLLGTHLGHSCISIMCSLLQNPKLLSDWPLLRSAVFFVGMGLWGSVRVKTLQRTPQSVLPSFHRALLTRNVELSLEVALTIQRLVRKYGHELQAVTWDQVLDIVVSLLNIMNEHDDKGVQSSVLPSLQSATHEIITFTEKLVQSEVYDGPVDRLFGIIERCVPDRPTESVFLLISYKLRAINPTKQNWIPSILLLVDTFYKNESRSDIRLKVVEVLSNVIEESMNLYEEELVHEVLVTSFKDIAKEKDLNVKTKCLNLLFQACLLANNEIPSILKLVDDTLSINWMEKCSGSLGSEEEKNFVDIEVIINGLIDVFKQKMYRCPGSHAIQVYNLLINFLKRIYSDVNCSSITADVSLIESRKKVFNLLLTLRANEKGIVYTCEDVKNTAVSSLVVVPQDQEDVAGDCGYLEFHTTLDCVISCLKMDNSWLVVDCVLTQLKDILQNKSMFTGNSPELKTEYQCVHHIDKIAAALCTMMSDAELTKKKSFNQQVAKYDMQASIISLLSSIICYHQWLNISRQRQILRCLETGFISRCARLCVQTMTLCIVEMPHDSLLRLLPSVVLGLTHMSATVHLSTAVLELLAVLAQMPGLYLNFVEAQYKSVFAAALQYTNTSKFSRYVVSLAHFVIGTWFTKCRMSFRPEFVGFINRILQSVNQADLPANNTKAVEAVRNNLMESCIDMMAQHTFSNGSIAPKRSPLAEFLFENGATATWLVGNKLVTITTSSPGKLPAMTKPMKLATSQRMVVSEAPAKLVSSTVGPVATSPRQRHKSGGAILKRFSGSLACDVAAGGEEDVSSSRSQPFGASDGEQSNSNLQRWLTSGWAEIYIRRPNGNCAWSMRIQNFLHCGNTLAENALSVHSALREMGLVSHTELKNESKDLADPNESGDCRMVSDVDENLCNEMKLRSHSSPDQPEIPGSPKAQDVGDVFSHEKEHSRPSTPPPMSSPGPRLRLRSHTVSTSKDCDVETAASKARNKAESRKYEEMTKHTVQFVDGESRRSASALATHGAKPKQMQEKSSHVSINRMNDITSPSYIFLQLFQSAWCTESIHRPILLPSTPAIQRSVQVLDRIPTRDTWATGVIYVGAGDGGNGDAILANEGGSPRYQEFLKGLGELVSLQECDPVSTFLGGLDTKGEDGEFTYVWKEDVLQMVFHITNFMPTRSDLAFKKRHIGNDYVIIAYDDDNGRYVPGCTIQGQFRSAELVITPLDKQTNHVRYVFHKELVEKAIGSDAGPWLISDKHLSVFVRQLALHACMAAFVCVGEGASSNEYSSKALARLKQIKRIRDRAMKELEGVAPSSKSQESKRQSTKRGEDYTELEEFSDYVR